MSIDFTNFYLDHQLNKHFAGTSDQDAAKVLWLKRIQDAFELQQTIPGYRDGVLLVRVDMDFQLEFRHRTITLTEGEEFSVTFSPRVAGETPRKTMVKFVQREELPYAASVFAVIYRKDVLAEGGERITSDWGVVSHLTSSIAEPEPMHPDTLIANHFHLNGGTQTGMTPVAFEARLRESVMFWRDKVIASIVEDL